MDYLETLLCVINEEQKAILFKALLEMQDKGTGKAADIIGCWLYSMDKDGTYEP